MKSPYRLPISRTDAEHAPILAGLRQAGRPVADTHALGQGFPDAVVGTGYYQIVLLEIKAPGQDLNDRERTFWDYWAGYPQLRLARSLEEALELTR